MSLLNIDNLVRDALKKAYDVSPNGKLSSDTNFTIWKLKTLPLIERNRYSKALFVKPEEVKDDKGENLKKYHTKEDDARSWLLAQLDETVYVCIEDAFSLDAYELWQSIEKYYDNKRDREKERCLRSMVGFRPDGKRVVEKHNVEYNYLLKGAGLSVSDPGARAYYIDGIPEGEMKTGLIILNQEQNTTLKELFDYVEKHAIRFPDRILPAPEVNTHQFNAIAPNRGTNYNNNHNNGKPWSFSYNNRIVCRYCKKPGHVWKMCNELKRYMSDKGYVKHHINAIMNINNEYKVTFLIDSGATLHLIGKEMAHYLSNIVEVNEFNVSTANGGVLTCGAKGQMKLWVSDEVTITLNDVFVTKEKLNGLSVISAGGLIRDKFKVDLRETGAYITKGDCTFNAEFYKDNLFRLSCKVIQPEKVLKNTRMLVATSIVKEGKKNSSRGVSQSIKGDTVLDSSSKGISQEVKGDIVLNNGMGVLQDVEGDMVLNNDEEVDVDLNVLHRVCGHMNNNDIKMAMKHNLVLDLDTIVKNKRIERCEGCQMGKQKSASYKPSSTITTRPLELVHTDVCGPFPVASLEGYKYYVTFIDDFTKYLVTYPIKNKSDVTEVFKIYMMKAERLLSPCKIVTVRSDRGGEYVGEFDRLCQQLGIYHQVTTAHTPEQNGVAERINQTLFGYIRSMVHGHDIPTFLWPEMLRTAVLMRNMLRPVLIQGETKSAWQRWWGGTPTAERFRVYGCVVFVKNRDSSIKKFEARSSIGILVGYSQTSKAWRVYIPGLRKVVDTSSAVFDETKIGITAIKGENTSKLFNELNDLDDSTIISKCSIEELPLTCSNQPEHIGDQLVNDDNPNVSIDQRGDNAHVDLQVNNNDNNLDESIQIRGDELSDKHDDDEDDEIIHIHSDDEENNSNNEVEEQGIDIVPDGSTGRLLKYTRTGAIYALCNATDKIEAPTSYQSAISHPCSEDWIQSMNKEMKSHEENGTWELVERPEHITNIIKPKWVYQIKTNEKREVVKLKSRLVAKGFTQKYGVDYDETFAPVVKMTSLRVFLSISASLDWEIDQIDVTTAYLNAPLEEEIYMEQPPGYNNDTNKVCSLKKALYGLKQSARAWNKMLNGVLEGFGFKRLIKDACVYVRMIDKVTTVVLVYVDDLLICCSDRSTLNTFKIQLASKFKITDNGNANYILGIQITRNREARTITLSQTAYIDEVLEKFSMVDANPANTPMIDANDLYNQIKHDESIPYRELNGCLMYISNTTRPDIALSVGILGRFNNKYNHTHFTAAKRVLRYLKSTKDYGLVLGGDVSNKLQVYADADYAGDLQDRKSTSGLGIFLGKSLVLWRSKKQQLTTLSTTEAEIIASTVAMQEMLWLKQLIEESNVLGTLSCSMYCDNQGAVEVINNTSHHGRTKHIDIKACFLRQHIIDSKLADMTHVPSEDMIADILTKPLPKDRHYKLMKQMNVDKM